MQPVRREATSTDAVADITRALESLLRLSSSRRVYAKQAGAAGATISQPAYVLLRRIPRDGPLAMGELARLTHMDPGATARQIGQLEKDGLVRRYPSPDDGRVNLVVLTRRGDAVRGRIASVLDGHLIRVLAGWSEQDQAVFAGLLSRFVDDMRARAYVPAEEESPAGTG